MLTLNLYEVLAKNVMDLVTIHEYSGNYFYVTPSVTNLLGWMPNELVGKHPKVFVHPEDFTKMEAFRQGVEKGDPSTNPLTSFRMLHKDGHYCWMESNLNMFYEEGTSNIKGFVATCRLVDEKIKIHQKLLNALKREKQLNEWKTKMVSITTHEFRTPLSIIASSMELLERRTEGILPETLATMQKFRNIIKKEVSHLQLLMDDVLKLERMEFENTDSQKSELDIEYFLYTILERLAPSYPAAAQVNIRTTGSHRLIYANQRLLFPVIENLLSNALKYSAGQPAPELAVHFEEEVLKLSIQDFGIGIPDKEIKRIRDPFYRASNTGEFSGTGVGLMIAQRYVEQQMGMMDISSIEGEGTLIEVLLPH